MSGRVFVEQSNRELTMSWKCVMVEGEREAVLAALFAKALATWLKRSGSAGVDVSVKTWCGEETDIYCRRGPG